MCKEDSYGIPDEAIALLIRLAMEALDLLARMISFKHLMTASFIRRAGSKTSQHTTLQKI